MYPAIALFCCCDSEYEVNVNSGAANGATVVVEAAVVEVVGGRFDTGTGTAVVEAAVEATAEVEVVGADVVGSTKVVVVPIFGF